MSYFVIFLAVLIRILANSGTNVFQKQLTQNNETPVEINFIIYLLLSIFSIPIFVFSNTITLNMNFWYYAILGGICGAICNCFMVLALEKGQLSVLSPINSYKAAIGLLFGMIILKEYPNIYGLCGMGLIIFGTYFIFDKPEDFLKKDILYRFLALIFSAIEAVFIKKVILLSSVSVSFAVSSLLGAVFSFIIFKAFCKSALNLKEKIKNKLYLYTAASFGLMTFITAFIFAKMNVGYALSLFQLSIILNVFLGYKLFKEQNLPKKLAGSVIILIGSTMIILLGH